MTSQSFIKRQFRLAARPVGLPKSSDWNFTSETTRDIADGEILVQVVYLSLDPAMRGWMDDVKSYIRPVEINEVMRAKPLGCSVRWNDMSCFKESAIS